MASFGMNRCIRLSNSCRLPQILRYLLLQNNRSDCFACCGRNLSFRSFSQISSTPTTGKISSSIISRRSASTQPAKNRNHDEEPSATSSTSSVSSSFKLPVHPVVDAANNAEYFKEAQQNSVLQSVNRRVKWDEFVDPDRPEGAVAGRVSRRDRFGQFSNPLTYPKKTRSTKSVEKVEEVDDVDWKEMEKFDSENRPFEVVKESDLELKDVEPGLQPYSHNLAAYANVSENIKKMLDMGVEVWRLDKDPEMSQRVVSANWEEKIQPWIDWMKDLSMSDEAISTVMSNYPRIMKIKLTELQELVKYFESKRFSTTVIGELVTKAPQLFAYSARNVDKRLGDLQKKFKLSGKEIRQIVTDQPRLVTVPNFSWNVLRLALVNELGFSAEEVKQMVINRPKIFRQEKPMIIDRFDYLHNVVRLPHDMIVKFPGVLLVRKPKIKERHLFLKSIKKNQYDPEKPNYISPDRLTQGKDSEFCAEVAMVPVEVFNDFIKTL